MTASNWAGPADALGIVRSLMIMADTTRPTLRLLRELRRERRRGVQKAIDPMTATLAVLLVAGYLGQLRSA
jgi:hypothetical protein